MISATMAAGQPTVADLRRAGVISRLRVVRVIDADAKAVVASAKLVTCFAQDRADEAAADVKASEAKLAKAVGKLGAEKLKPEEQRRRLIEGA
ncbi:hypothetical protein MKK84_02535 [Methylobacterium sp. E-065]|uniref:hypothetical protein n=1 Tax=Methylobacterium sp. E-065 TaxID=2836583 RepID=UPI001FB8E53F|nr:hypothetical protein [Methylobacterium sp. E-065]MCJ2016312.1 hypothetical protein [Methylobacterium sp. E-065]